MYPDIVQKSGNVFIPGRKIPHCTVTQKGVAFSDYIPWRDDIHTQFYDLPQPI
jgi:hypothetical protein